jgi:hypothetical protein
MATVTDAKFDALRALLHTGAMPEMTLSWLQAAGATSSSLPDAWNEMLAIKLITPVPTGQRNDDWFEYLGVLTHTGSLNDRELAFWVSGGVLP